MLAWHAENLAGFIKMLSTSPTWTPADMKCYLSTWDALDIDKWIATDNPHLIENKANTVSLLGIISKNKEENARLKSVEHRLEEEVEQFISTVRAQHPFSANESNDAIWEKLQSVSPEISKELGNRIARETDRITRMVERITSERQKIFGAYPPCIQRLLEELSTSIEACKKPDQMQAVVLRWYQSNLQTIKDQITGRASDDIDWTKEVYAKYLSALDKLGVRPYIELSPEAAAIESQITSFFETAPTENEIIKTLKALHPLDPSWDKRLESFCNEQKIESDDRENRVREIIKAVDPNPGKTIAALIQIQCDTLGDHPNVKALFVELHERVKLCVDRTEVKRVVVSWKLKNLKKTAAPDDRDDDLETSSSSPLNADERAAYKVVCQTLMLDGSLEDIELPEWVSRKSPGAS